MGYSLPFAMKWLIEFAEVDGIQLQFQQLQNLNDYSCKIEELL